MAAKPFYPTFDYTPKWKGNRERAKSEPGSEMSVRLRDFPESKKIALTVDANERTEKIQAEIRDKANTPEGSALITNFRTDNLKRSLDLVKKQFVSVSNLIVIVEDEKEIEIKTADDLCTHCEDLAVELAVRLVTGPDEEEQKNS